MEEILHQLVGSLSHYLRWVLWPSQVVVWDFWTINSMLVSGGRYPYLVQQYSMGVPLVDEPMPTGMNFGAPWPREVSPVDFWQTPKNIQRRRWTAGTWEYGPPWKKENHLNQTIIFRFYVHLRGVYPCKMFGSWGSFFFGVASQAFTGSVVFLKMDLRWFTGCCTTLISSLSIITLEQGRLFSLICILCVPYIYIFTAKTKGKGLLLSKLRYFRYGLGFAKLWTTPCSGWKA